jgi:ketosteroid isomerase-like protein
MQTSSRSERVKRNLAIAEKFFDGYHNSVERGRLENVFMPEDFASEWDFCSPFLGGQMHQAEGWELAQGAAANHAMISQKIPDYKMDHFRAWPTEKGCAWRWCVNGHGVDGRYYAFWEQLFIWTNDDGKITRFEFYDDWHGFPQTLIFAYGTTLDGFTKIAHYGAAPWTPGSSMAIDPGVPKPRSEPPANDKIARNLSIAQRAYDACHNAASRGSLTGAFTEEDFAKDWTLFSPWFGERRASPDWDCAAFAALAHKRIQQRLPDYKMDHFEAWPTEDGCAWRWCVNGHSADGTYYEVWEQMFIQTDGEGKITRLEFFDDWQGFPQTLGFITGLTIDQLWDADNFVAWVKQTAA